MIGRTRRREARRGAWLLTLALTGCGAPPSVAPILRVSEQALQREVEQMSVDASRDREASEQLRLSLRRAFEADLQQAAAAEKAWVLEAVDVYTAAREAVARHEMSLAAERRQRADNLRAVIEAQRRAAQLIERQDELIARTLGLDLWRLTTAVESPTKER